MTEQKPRTISIDHFQVRKSELINFIMGGGEALIVPISVEE
jgi:hypothetical protein